MYKRKELKIGIFAVTVILVSFFMLNFFKGKDILNKNIELYSLVEDIDGLVVSSQVLMKGFVIGKVGDIEYLTDSKNFKITYIIKKEFKLPVDTKFTILGLDVMGTKGVKVKMGTSSKMVESEEYIQSVVVPNMLDELTDNISPILLGLSQTLGRVDSIAINMNSLFSEQNKANISSAISNLNFTVKEVKELASNINGRSNDIQEFISNLEDLASKLVVIGEKADTSIDNINDISESINKANVEELLKSFNGLLDKIQDPDGSIGKLLNEDAIYDSADKLILDINSLITEIKNNPKKYIKITIF